MNNDDTRKTAARANAIAAAIGAALMLYFGFGTVWFHEEGAAGYNAAVDVVRYTLQYGGMALALIALACFAGVAYSLAADAVVSSLIGLSFLGCGLVWLLHSDMQGLLFMVFGIMFLSSARHCWSSYSQPVATGQPALAPPAEPVHPASLRPDVLPQPDEPPPPEGYLAALAREKQEPPRADLE